MTQFYEGHEVDHNKFSLPSSIPNPGGVSEPPDHAGFWETAFLNHLDTPRYLFPFETSRKLAPSSDSLGLSSSD